jgi:hypothetical protein
MDRISAAEVALASPERHRSLVSRAAAGPTADATDAAGTESRVLRAEKREPLSALSAVATRSPAMPSDAGSRSRLASSSDWATVQLEQRYCTTSVPTMLG